MLICALYHIKHSCPLCWLLMEMLQQETPHSFFLELQLYVTVSFFKNVSNILFGFIY